MRIEIIERYRQYLFEMLMRCMALLGIPRRLAESPGDPLHHRPTAFTTEDICCSTPPKYRVLAWQLINLPLQRFFVLPPAERLALRFSASQCERSPELHLLALLHKHHIWHQSSDDEHHLA